MQKTIYALLLILFGVVNTAFTQFSSIDNAVAYINDILKDAPTAVEFTLASDGEVKKKDEYNSVYEFNMKSIGAVAYEQQGRSHFVRLMCASGSKCFYSEQNLGGGMFHMIETNSIEEANRLIAAFEYIIDNINVK